MPASRGEQSSLITCISRAEAIDLLRESQLEETLKDTNLYSAGTPVLLGRGFQLDASAGNVAAEIRQAQFQDAFANQHVATTPNAFLEDGTDHRLDFSRGPHSPRPTTGPPLRVGIRPLPSVDHFAFSLAGEAHPYRRCSLADKDYILGVLMCGISERVQE